MGNRKKDPGTTRIRATMNGGFLEHFSISENRVVAMTWCLASARWTFRTRRLNRPVGLVSSLILIGLVPINPP